MEINENTFKPLFRIPLTIYFVGILKIVIENRRLRFGVFATKVFDSKEEAYYWNVIGLTRER